MVKLDIWVARILLILRITCSISVFNYLLESVIAFDFQLSGKYNEHIAIWLISISVLGEIGKHFILKIFSMRTAKKFTFQI